MWAEDIQAVGSREGDSYQSLGGAVERVPVVSPELGVGTVKRGVPLSLGLLDAIVEKIRCQLGFIFWRRRR